MNQEKMGKFIAELRKEKNLTQYELAEKITITRDAVSKWEQGKRCPDPECLVKLSEIFEVSINELLLGEKESQNNKEEVANVSIKLYGEKNKIQKNIKRLFVIIILIVISFLGYYFFNTYNSLKVYLVSYDSESLKIQDGVLVMTNERLYFNLGNIETNSEIKLLELFYKDEQNKEKLIVKTDGLNIIFNDFKGYNEYFDFSNIKSEIDNLYLKIIYEDTEDIVKLDINKHFSNDNLLSENEIDASAVKLDFNKSINNLEKKIKESFSCLDNFCSSNYKDYELIYIIDARTLSINLNNNKNKHEWAYNFNNENLIFQEYNKDIEVINKYIKNKNNGTCEIGKCKDIEKEIIIFNDIVSSIVKSN